MSEKLKPCPFCGSPNIDPKGWGSTQTSGPACDDCGASAGSSFKSEEENVEAWNRRHQEQEETSSVFERWTGK